MVLLNNKKNGLANFTMLSFKCRIMLALVLILETIFFAQSKLRNYINLLIWKN